MKTDSDEDQYPSNVITDAGDSNSMSGEFDEQNQTLQLTKLTDKMTYEFDYEVNSVKLDNSDEMDCKMLIYNPSEKTYKPINYNEFHDKLLPLPKITPSKKMKNPTSIYDAEFEELDESAEKKTKTANFFKRLVSKQKRRYQDEEFDLDMSYITEKVIAMGYPSTGIQSLYRNSITDIIKFFHVRHDDQVKVYNLCLEKDRIYPKNLFNNLKVGLFPSTDHNPCPIKLILEFCIDICLYLTNNPKGVAAVHCKAGKGRTGVMICSYLIFSGLCETSEKAFRYYARIRTKNNTGVTIASQKRYIKYFENFLESNFYPPYIYLIPKILKTHFSHLIIGEGKLNVKNILHSFQTEKSYFISANTFKLKGVKLGPFSKSKHLRIKICNFINNDFKLNIKNLKEKEVKDKDGKIVYYYEQTFNQELKIYSDIRIKFKEEVNFYVWVNLWYSTWEMIKKFYDKENNIPICCGRASYASDLENSDSPKEINNKMLSDENNNKIDESDNNLTGSLDSRPSQSKSLYEIIYKLKHNTDLNELINHINNEVTLKHFDKNNLTIKLGMIDFDKFQEKKEYKKLDLEIYYGLMDNK